MTKISKIIALIKSKKIYYMPFGFVLIGIFSLSPYLVALLAGLIGQCLGCNINEGGTDDCIRLGIPFGIILNPLGVMGWLLLITIPLGIMAFVAWFIYCIVATIRTGR